MEHNMGYISVIGFLNNHGRTNQGCPSKPCVTLGGHTLTLHVLLLIKTFLL